MLINLHDLHVSKVNILDDQTPTKSAQSVTATPKPTGLRVPGSASRPGSTPATGMKRSGLKPPGSMTSSMTKSENGQLFMLPNSFSINIYI